MKLRITVDNKAYEVDVDVLDDDTAQRGQSGAGQTRMVSAGGVSANASAAVAKPTEVVGDEAKVVRSPIMGIVVKVNAQPGQDIQVNDSLLILEAMKMESSITSPVQGKIKEVRVKATDSVENGQVVVVFE